MALGISAPESQTDPSKEEEDLPKTRLVTIEPCKLPRMDEILVPLIGSGMITRILQDRKRLSDFCEKYGSSQVQVLHVVWGLVLRLYTGNDTVCFGTCESPFLSNTFQIDRSLKATTSLISLALLTTDTPLSVLNRLKMENLATQYPLTGLLQVPFDTILIYADEELTECEVAEVCNGLNFSEVNLSITVGFSFKGNKIIMHIKFSPSKMSEASVINIANTFDNILHSVTADPLQQIGRLDTISLPDYEQILEWNETTAESSTACVHHFIERHAQQHSQLPAIDSHDGSLTYRELNELSTTVGEYLSSLEIGPEILVPICFEKSKWAIIAMVGILKAGGAFVPMDPSHPVDRLATIIQKTQASLIVTSPTYLPKVEGLAPRTCAIGQALVNSLNNSEENFPSNPSAKPQRAKAENIAFVLFTSGSTGEPKGIVQEHGSVCTNALSHGPALAMSSESRVLQFAAYTFDVSMMDIFTTFILGGCVCIPSEDSRMNDIVGFINRTKVNWALLTPSYSNLICPDDVPTLRTLVLGGEAVTRDNIRRWADKVNLINCYGPAEAGTCIVSPTPIAHYTNAETVGCRLSSASCWLVDPSDDDRLVSIGAVGELCVEGPTLARDYLGDPVLTKAQFIENPSWLKARSQQNQRIYKVGDLFRQNSNGSFNFVGRIDSQVKIRGQRVELGEVEHHLCSLSTVAACVVANPMSGRYQGCLVAVVEIESAFRKTSILRPSLEASPELRIIDPHQITLDTSEISSYMEQSVPTYMVPNVWILVDKLPLSTSAKIDKKKVKVWLTTLDQEVRTSVATDSNGGSPEDLLLPHETTAVDISIEVANVIAATNAKLHAMIKKRNVVLAQVGMDSIQAISLVMTLRQKYGVKIGVEHLTHKGVSIRNLARTIEMLQHESSTTTTMQFDLVKEWQRLLKQLVVCSGVRQSRGPVVLVTGATGFLGMRILSHLLSHSSIRKVLAHVRADAFEHSLKAIEKAEWWSETFRTRLEIWPGDLEKPRLGLSALQWSQIAGNTTFGEGERVDIVIHNGASVRWNADFETLKAANVGSTLELLTTILDSRSNTKLIYVSGGQAMLPHDESDEETLKRVAFSNGYCQTKTLSELLVKGAMKNPRHGTQFSIVKPSYIIGSPLGGVANTADYLWRLVWSCINVQAYNAEERGAWLYISDVDRVARSISDQCLTPFLTGQITKILDSIKVRDFWAILTGDFGYILEPLDQEVWMSKINNDLHRQKEEHKLWPLLNTLEEGKGKIGVSACGLNGEEVNSARVKEAVRTNIEYLVHIKFFPPPPNLSQARADSTTEGCERIGVGLTDGDYQAT